MVTINRILCPVDFSGHSRVALDYATALARWYEAELVVLHAYAVAMVPATIGAFPAATAVGMPLTRAELEQDLNRFAHPVIAAGVKTTTLVTMGSAARSILETAEHVPANLIVMGTHGASGFERLMLGSVTEKVLRKARCPVLVVTRHADAPSGAPTLFRRILCAVDFSSCSTKAIWYALSLAEEAGGSLTFLHVVEGFDDEPLESAHFNVPEYRRHLVAAAEQRLATVVPSEKRTWCECKGVVRTGKAYREILETARTEDADLIVLGVRGRNAVDVALFGSTTNHVVRTAGCPVLTVRS
ncbi:MAG TPA: universal stress protein [Vicinamibacterales bacterium]|nr:universal stress protein [Vicinamibacterales bacterium]